MNKSCTLTVWVPTLTPRDFIYVLNTIIGRYPGIEDTFMETRELNDEVSVAKVHDYWKPEWTEGSGVKVQVRREITFSWQEKI